MTTDIAKGSPNSPDTATAANLRKTAANLRQVGGQHYKTIIEHWDYVVANDLNYFEGQITKYVTRARKKNGLEDLLKAKHFLEKYMEVYTIMTGVVEISGDPLVMKGLNAP